MVISFKVEFWHGSFKAELWGGTRCGFPRIRLSDYWTTAHEGRSSGKATRPMTAAVPISGGLLRPRFERLAWLT